MNLKERREALGLSAADVGKLVGVSAVSIWHYENGGYKPKYPTNQKLADLYGCTVEDIMSDPSDGPNDTPPAVP